MRPRNTDKNLLNLMVGIDYVDDETITPLNTSLDYKKKEKSMTKDYDCHS